MLRLREADVHWFFKSTVPAQALSRLGRLPLGAVAPVAQWIEHTHRRVEVPGSNPGGGIILPSRGAV
jgi:hypothetical protein